MPVSAHAAAQAPSKLGLQARRDHQGRDRDQRHRHQVGQRRRGGGRRSARRRRGRIRQADDRQGARARHDAHDLPQRLRPAGRRSRSPPRATRPCSAAPSRTASRTITAISRPAPSPSAASTIRNHNHLLGSVDGVDGIKTGYIRDSGFNIVTSVHRGGRHIVAVVFGGRTADARDARMRSLIDNNINVAVGQAHRAAGGRRLARPREARAKDSDGRRRPRRQPRECRAAAPARHRTAAGARLDRSDQAQCRSRPFTVQAGADARPRRCRRCRPTAAS